ALRRHPRVLADSVRRRTRGAIPGRLRPRSPDEAFSARVARHARRAGGPVLLLLAGADRQLADPGPDRFPVHLAVRRRDSAAALPARHSTAVRDVALSDPRDRCARDVAVRVRVGAGEWTALRAGHGGTGRRRLLYPRALTGARARSTLNHSERW